MGKGNCYRAGRFNGGKRTRSGPLGNISINKTAPQRFKAFCGALFFILKFVNIIAHLKIIEYNEFRLF